MLRANRYFYLAMSGTCTAFGHPWTPRHTHIPVQNTPLSSEGIPIQVSERPPTLALLVV